MREHLPADAEAQADETPGGGLAGELAAVAEVAPQTAVLEAFVRIEKELYRIGVNEGIPREGVLDRLSGRNLAILLNKRGRVSNEAVAAIDGLTLMRNLAAHGRAGDDLDAHRALEYVHIADAVLFALRVAKPTEDDDGR